MNIDNIVKVFKENESKHPDDSRQIIKNKNNVMYGNEIGVVLSNIESKIFEVFVHAKINGEVISQILYSTFNSINDAIEYYNRLERYIIDFDMKGLISEINN